MLKNYEFESDRLGFRLWNSGVSLPCAKILKKVF